jgi:hypothetical protein
MVHGSWFMVHGSWFIVQFDLLRRCFDLTNFSSVTNKLRDEQAPISYST